MPRLLSLTLLATSFAAFALADDSEPATGAKSKPVNPGLSAVKPPTLKVEKAPFKVEVTLKGVFESSALTEVSIKPEVWSGAMGGLGRAAGGGVGVAVAPGAPVVSRAPHSPQNFCPSGFSYRHRGHCISEPI